MPLRINKNRRYLSPPGLHARIGQEDKNGVESRLLADLLLAESALKQYQTTKAAGELAIQRIAAAHNSETLRAETLLRRQLVQPGLLLSSGSSPLLASWLQDTTHEQHYNAISQNFRSALPLSGFLPATAGPVSRPLAHDAAIEAFDGGTKTTVHPDVSVSAGLREPKSLPKSNMTQFTKDNKRTKKHSSQQASSGHRECKTWPVSASFPSKLFHILEYAEVEGHDGIISFLPDGKAFKVHEPERFAQEVLPKYFKTRRISSFQKQLSLYGFKKIRSGNNDGSIGHEFFQRDDKKLVAKITRKKQRVPSGDERVHLCGERNAILHAALFGRQPW